MKYYIITPETTVSKNEQQDYKIIKVNPVDEANFLEDYGHRIITKGDTIQEAIINFEQWKSNK